MNASNLTSILLALAVILTPFSANADVRDEINAIKLDENYLFAEGTDEDKNIAFDNALYELLLLVNEIRSGSQKPVLETSHLVSVVENKSYMRGEKTLAFVYISIEKALALMPKQSLGIVVGAGQQPADTVAAAPQQNTTVQTPAPEAQQQSSPQQQKLNFVAGKDITSATARLCEYEMATEAGLALKKYSAEGTVSQFGRARSMAEIPADAYLLLFDREQVIKAILSPDTGSGRTNMRTHQPDALANYHQVAVIWYR